MLVREELDWRFFTVPGNPADGLESEALEMAVDTWTGEWWQYGGGGTVWDSMAYDPELDLLYFGVGQRLALGSRRPQPGRRRQSFPVIHRCGAAGYRCIRLALPDNAGRDLGLHGDAAHRSCRPRFRRWRHARS